MSAALVLAVLVAAAVGRPMVRRALLGDRARRRADVGDPTSGARPLVPEWFDAAWRSIDAGVRVEAALAWSVAVVVGVGIAVWATMIVPQLVVLTLLLAGAALVLRGPVTRRRTRRGYEGDLLAALATVAASLGGGASLSHALHRASTRAGPCGTDVAGVRHHIDAGWSVQSALDHWATSRQEPAVTLVADALAVAGSAGASQERAIVAVAATIRDRADRDREIRALASQARTSCAVLVATPVGFSIVVSTLDRRVIHFLLGSAAGWACIIGGLALDATGAWWMARLVRRVR